MLNSQTEHILNQLTQDLRHLLGEDLVALVLYGSAVGRNFVPEASDLNLVIVVKEARFEVLQKLQPHIATWHTRGFALPLLLDQEFLQQARDVFPMEFYDIKEQHRLLWGQDVFHDLEIDSRHLRFQAEHEARSKLLRLRALYLECAEDQTRLRTLTLDSVKTFLILMRNLMRLQGQAGLLTYTEVLERFEQHFQCTFPRMHQLIAIRSGQQPWPAATAADFFHNYLVEIQQIIGVIDRLHPHASSTHNQAG